MVNRSQIKEALSNLLSSKLRTVLAVLGILIGTGSVVAMVTSGELATQQALAQFKKLGTNLMSVTIYNQRLKPPTAQSSLSYETIIAMQHFIPSINNIAPYAMAFAPVIYHDKRITANTIGVTYNLQKILKIDLKQGRFISKYDHFEPYCVIGYRVYNAIKKTGTLNPIGKQIQLGKQIFTIIGVADAWPVSQFFNQSIDFSVLIPIQASSLISQNVSINNMVLSLNKNADINKVDERIRYYFTTLHHKRVFTRSAKKIIASMQSQSRIYTLLLGLIGSISLLVGGIGIMNIMLVSVTERRREIGIRMAVGATPHDIWQLFLIEAVILSLLGGVAGIIAGLLTSFIIAHFAGWHFTFYLLPPFIGFAVSAATGIFFGYYPAYQASRLDPIQTLRSE